MLLQSASDASSRAALPWVSVFILSMGKVKSTANDDVASLASFCEAGNKLSPCHSVENCVCVPFFAGPPSCHLHTEWQREKSGEREVGFPKWQCPILSNGVLSLGSWDGLSGCLGGESEVSILLYV